ncbi:hypothetical protein AVEN_235203-1, partial [Araneus ventricosus]
MTKPQCRLLVHPVGCCEVSSAAVQVGLAKVATMPDRWTSIDLVTLGHNKPW